MLHTHFFKSKIFRKTLVSYFCLFLVPICVLGAVLISSLYGSARQSAYRACETAWQKTTDLLENQFRVIEELKMQLFGQAWAVERDRDAPSVSGADALTRAGYTEQLRQVVQTTTALRECAVYFPDEQYVLGSRVSLSYPDYSHYLERVYDLSLTPESFQGLAASACYLQNSRNLAVVFSLQISLAPRAYGLLILDQETLQKAVTEWMGEGQLVISGAETVFLHLNEENASGWSFERSSQYTDFTYRASFPARLELSPSRLLLTLGGILLLLGIGGVLAFVSACFTYKPLYALFHDNIFLKDSEINEYQSIQMLLNDTVAENILMREDAEAALPILRDETLRTLLKGFFSSQKEIQSEMERHGIPFQADWFFTVLIIRIPKLPSELPPDAAARELERLCSDLPCAAQWLETIAGEYVVILGMKDSRPDTGRIGRQLRYQLSSCLKAPVLLFCGEPQQGVIGISLSFQSAKDVMFDGDAARADSALKSFYFPFDWELQLSDALTKGEGDVVRRILYQMLLENQKKDLLEAHADEVVQAVLELVEQVLTENDCFSQPDASGRIAGLEPDQRWLELVEYAAAAAERLREARSSPEQRTSLKAYVDEHYCSSVLSLKELCQHFGMSESMVSKTFKAEAGENFYQYLTRKRMARAKELLLSRCYDVQTIAAMTGYESRNSFTRAFIRSEGVKPSEFVTQAK